MEDDKVNMDQKKLQLARTLLSLTSREKAAAVLHDVYGLEEEEITPLLGGKPTAPPAGKSEPRKGGKTG